MPPNLWIFDNAVLSNFARINRLDLLLRLPLKYHTTREVLEEMKRGIATKPGLQKIVDAIHQKNFELVEVKNDETVLWMAHLKREGVLGIGEISAMGVCKELGGIFVTDDEVATKKARQNGIQTLHEKRYHGTVIILEILEKEGIIDEKILDIIREQLKTEGFYC